MCYFWLSFQLEPLMLKLALTWYLLLLLLIVMPDVARATVIEGRL